MTTPPRCPTCHQAISPTPGPIAHKTHLTFCGRRVFSIEGRWGLWCSEPDVDERGKAESVDVVMADSGCKGARKYRRLYLLKAVSEETEAVFKQGKQEG